MKPIRVNVRDRSGDVVEVVEFPRNPTVEETVAANLRTLAERTHAQLDELAKDPTPDRCDLMVRALAEVSAQVRRLSTELQRQPK